MHALGIFDNNKIDSNNPNQPNYGWPNNNPVVVGDFDKQGNDDPNATNPTNKYARYPTLGHPNPNMSPFYFNIGLL